MTKTPLTYYGGKQSMLGNIVPKIVPHKIYCEPYLGGGAVFFGKPWVAYLEVLNDKNDRLITFYDILQTRFDELYARVSNTLHSEYYYRKAKAIYQLKVNHTAMDMAWAIWVLCNMSFGGTMHGGWKWDNGSSGGHTGKVVSNKIDSLAALRGRLRDVQISSRDALDVIDKRDTNETFFYIDTPYPGTDQKHYGGFTFRNFSTQLEQLTTLKGKFLLSGYWSQTLRYFILKNGWQHERIQKNLKVANFDKPRVKTEILVWNYELKQDPRIIFE